MRYNPDVHHRKSIRLKDYDYSKEGMYFVTICTKDRENILSKIVGADDPVCPNLTNIGEIVNEGIMYIGTYYRNVETIEYVIMPNHLHFILDIQSGQVGSPAPTVYHFSLAEG